MPRHIHITNSQGRDTTIAMQSTTIAKPPRRGLPGREVSFKRYVAVGEGGRHDELALRYGDDYAQALIDGDPDVDAEIVGRAIKKTDRVYLSSTGDVLYAAPEVVEVIFGPDGKERDRRAPEDVQANVNDALPVRWTGRTMPKGEVTRRFAFRRTVQMKHVDGLTYDYLFKMAKELSDSNVMVLMGAGDNGKKPLIFTANGSPYRGFLEGRVDGDRYKLLLHLSNIELRRPSSSDS